MTSRENMVKEHSELTRRHFMQLGAAGAVAMSSSSLWASDSSNDQLLDSAISKLEYLTRLEDFRVFGRGNPKPHTLPPEELREVGLHRDTWKMEVIADPESNSVIEHPLSKELGTALDWAGLMQLAKKNTVRYMKVMKCTNVSKPCGMGLWEGVPLRDVIWLVNPKSNIRRVFFYGYHNDKPDQRFQSSLPFGRVLEDPPGEHPVILCFKLNGQWLTPAAGAPVRMVVPERYGNASVKWIQRVVLTNNPQSNDTYAKWNNDTVSQLKTYAHFLESPETVRAGQPFAITGLAQVGMSGLSKVQYCLIPTQKPWPADDPYFTGANWVDAEVLPPPNDWGGGLPDGKLPPISTQFSGDTGKPLSWPLRNTIVHWAALVPDVSAGAYNLCCRTIDSNGYPQPMPRPYRKSGRNIIHTVPLSVDA